MVAPAGKLGQHHTRTRAPQQVNWLWPMAGAGSGIL
jgi:hypothetical protein